MYDWIHDDITWCANECEHTECFRNMIYRKNHRGLISMAYFKGTDTCPLTNIKEKEGDPNDQS